MKKVLFATTALIATAGVAAADVTLSGSAQMGLIYQENTASSATNNEVTLNHEVNLGVSMSTTTDGGLTAGAAFTIEGDEGTNDSSVVYISGAFGKLSFGDDVAEAGEVANIADIGFDGASVDDVVEDLQEVMTADVHYSYSAGGLSFGVSVDLGDGAHNGQTTTNTTTPWSAGAAYTMGGVKVSVGMSDLDDTAGTEARSLGVSYSMDALSVSLAMVERTVSNVDTRGTGLSVGYKIDGANTITAAWADRDTAGYDSSFGVGMTSNLGGGVTLNVGVASVYNTTAADHRTNAQVGLAMSF